MTAQLAAIHHCLCERRYASAIGLFNTLSQAEKNDPETCYQAGYALMHLHKPQTARPLLEQAAKGNFAGYKDWPSTQSLLDDIAEMAKFTPPHCLDIGDKAQPTIRAFAKETDWTTPVLKALPLFFERARAVFGAQIPPINFYFFDERRDFERFYTRMFGVGIPTSWHDGTGDANIVVFCEQDRTGNISRPAGVDRTVGDVLHEYGHALCNTIFGDNYLERVPQWLDEGMADAIASPYYQSLFQVSDRLLTSESGRRSPPSYDQMCEQLYKDPDLGYAIARMMVGMLVRKYGVPMFKRIIDEARQIENFETAIDQMSGLKCKQLYKSVVNHYWRPGSPKL
jgi:hypothetical protein